ncbi:alpha/beta hydrolase [Nocardia sp. NBC_01730]|uniref:alpha/beta fold hydrolase n=1 Tax=Nocardia sp. NBC_01730 TaxID=2975998 RepID=UPI002E0DDF05|nr:alpha/beta hydrolase [Nocardia sp. NBC_01730]
MRRLPIPPQCSTATSSGIPGFGGPWISESGFPTASITAREKRTTSHLNASPLTVEGPDGTPLSASRLGAASPPASVLYVHGALTQSTYWTPLIEYVHQRLDGGIAQIVYDQRGHGASKSQAPNAGITLPVYVDDLDAVLAHAHGAVVLVAHSVGSLLIQAWAAQYPHRARAVTGIVLFNGCPEFPYLPALSDVDLTGSRYRKRGLQVVEELLTYLYEPPARYGLSRRHLFGTAERNARSGNFETSPAGVALYRDASLTSETARTLRRVPTWVMTGQLDPVVDPRRSQHLAEQVWGEYVSVPGAGHSLPYVDPVTASEPILAALEVAYRSQQQDGGPW